MPISFGGIALGVLIGYPLGGAAYQMIGKSAPFILISICIALTMRKLLFTFNCKFKKKSFSIADYLSKRRAVRHKSTDNEEKLQGVFGTA